MAIMLTTLKVFSFTPINLLCLFVFIATDVEGFAYWCEINHTIFVPEDTTAKFQTTVKEYYYFEFFKYAPDYRYIFDGRKYDKIINDEDLIWYDHSWINRTHIHGQENTNYQLDIRIELSNVSMNDNGKYYLSFRDDVCFTLFVLQIQLEPKGAIEENEPVYLYVHPHASLITRPLTNATMVWLVDGLSINQTASFIAQDGLIWLPSIQRGMDGRNVTYRAVQDNGDISEINYTLDVTYGPSQPLTLTPGGTHYYLVSGDVMPNITCTVDCKPSCSVSWGEYSSDGTLSLGTVTSNDTGQYTCSASRTGVTTVVQTVNIDVADEQAWFIELSPQKVVYILSVGDKMPEISCTANCNPPCDVSWGIHSPSGILTFGTVSMETTGEYICTATRKGSERRIEKSVTVYVEDNTSFTIAIACLAAVQALTTLGLGLCAVHIYRKNKQMPCQTCFSNIARKPANKNTGDGPNMQTVDNPGLEHYVEVNTDITQTNKVYEATSDSSMEIYETI